MKRLIYLLVLFSLTCFWVKNIFSQTISLENVEASVGSSVLVPINFSGMNNIGAITIFILFDSDVLVFEGITNLVSQGNGTIYNFIPSPPQVALSWVASGSSGVNFPNGKYLDLEFTYNGGTTELIFSPDCDIVDWDLNPVNVTYINGSVSASGVYFNLKVFLEGAYQPGSGGSMKTDLATFGSLPLVQPYNPPMPYYGNSQPVWQYNGTESVSEIPTGVVDWVLIELRDALIPSNATSGSIVAQKPCFLMNDGSIVGLDGVNMPFFNVSFNQGAFVVVYHRNHLGIMSSMPVNGFGNTYFYDFTTGQDKINGGNQGYTELESGKWGMSAGDINADNDINVMDKTIGWETDTPSAGYLGGDINMDIQVNNPDKNDFILENFGKVSGIPE